MTIFEQIQDLWVRWAQAFDEGIAQLPGIGQWVQPKWIILIADRDGSFSRVDGPEAGGVLAPDHIRKLGRQNHICLRLGKGLGQRRDILLPQAASHDPASAIRLSLEQYFPFPAKETAFAIHGAAQPSGPHHSQFRVSFARHSVITQCKERLQALGVNPKAIDALGEHADESVNADLQRGTNMADGKSASFVLAALCTLLLVFGGLVSLWSNLSLAPAMTDARAANLPTITADQALRQKQAKTTAPSVLRLWQAATQSLPDNAYAEYLLYEKGRLRIAGKAKDAASLVSAIEAQFLFEGTTFASASLKEDNGEESFDLVTNVLEAAQP